VRVGIGASRQDVNVSVCGGRRVEIKGVPRAGWAPALVHGEAVRQVQLLALRDELHRRGFSTPNDVIVEHRDVTGLADGGRVEPLRREHWDTFVARHRKRPDFELGAGPFCVRAVRLPRLAGILHRPTQPGRVFADELRGRVRVIAGLDQDPILLDSEAWPTTSGAAELLEALRRELGCSGDDALAVVWGPEQDTLTAAEEIRLRLVDALDGVPNETRQPFVDGSTDFERILPGPDRMYPDTDSPPQPVTRERVARLNASLPEPPWVREARYHAAGVPEPLSQYLIRRGGARLVDLVTARCGADLRRACFFFGERVKSLRRAGLAVDEVPDSGWCALFELFTREPVTWEAWRDLTEWLIRRPDDDLLETAQAAGFGIEPEDWRERVGTLILEARSGPAAGIDRQHRFMMGLAMDELRGRVFARDVAHEVRERTTAPAATAVGAHGRPNVDD
jgi:glutamyl-tRNA(Gln) amidotransferase subunit E